MSYFSNECFICKSTETLKICGSCNMISYCGSKHQKLDWSNHKEFCNAISLVLKETGTSHIYEKQLNSDLETWTKEREQMSSLIETVLGRPLLLHEEQMILMPRSCFVCHNTQQESLTNCPNCRCVNFCETHQNSLEHDKDCGSLQLFRDLDGEVQDPSKLRIILSIIKNIVEVTFRERIPENMEEFLSEYIIGSDAILIKSCASNMLSMPLTLYNAIKRLNLNSATDLILHVRCELPDSDIWELLLHFLPNLLFLKIIFFDQPEAVKTKMKLCSECCEGEKKLILQMKDLSYGKFVEDELYTKPNLIALMPIEGNEDEEWENLREVISRVGCPLVLTCVTESKANKVGESLKTTFWTNLKYEGLNSFGALEPLREWTNYGIGKINQYLIVAEGRNVKCRAKHFPNQSPLLLKKEAGEFWNQQHFFFSHVCRSCRAKSSIVTCRYCQMVFYCSEVHRREDWYLHKDLCKLIQKLLLASGRRSIFAGELDLMQCQKADPEQWLEAKLGILEKVEKEFDRELFVFEQQMFLFPKTCFACHESDLLKLFICRCGTPLCKTHKDFRGHKAICSDLYLCYLLHENEEIVQLPEFQFVSAFDNKLPESMQKFLTDWIICPNDRPFSSIEKILIGELLTRPLTLLFALEKLQLQFTSMVIHVIGAHNSKHAGDEFWNVLFVWLKKLKNVSIVYLGVGTKHLNSTGSNNLQMKSYPLTYEEFRVGKFFSKPDIIIGYDLDIHECKLEDCSCVNDILAVRKLGVPFIMTSGTKERACDDNRKISRMFETPVAPEFAYLNPFASLEPLRDFETEYLRYLNKCVVIYLKWKPSKDEKIDIFQADLSRSYELEKKLAELLFTKPKNEEVEKPNEVIEEFWEEPKRPISTVFAANSELKYLLKDCGYKEENVSGRKKLEEPDLQFVKCTTKDPPKEEKFTTNQIEDQYFFNEEKIGLKYLLNDCEYKEKNSSSRKKLEEPDLQFVKCTTKDPPKEEKFTTNQIEDQYFPNEEKIETNRKDFSKKIVTSPTDIDVKCCEIFESLLASSNTQNDDEIDDVQLYETFEDIQMGEECNQEIATNGKIENPEGKSTEIPEEDIEPKVEEHQKDSVFSGLMKNLFKMKANETLGHAAEKNSENDFEELKEENSDVSKDLLVSGNLPTREEEIKSETRTERLKRNPFFNVSNANAELKSMLTNFKSNSSSTRGLSNFISENGKGGIEVEQNLESENEPKKSESGIFPASKRIEDYFKNLEAEKSEDGTFEIVKTPEEDLKNLEVESEPKNSENETFVTTERFDDNLKNFEAESEPKESENGRFEITNRPEENSKDLKAEDEPKNLENDSETKNENKEIEHELQTLETVKNNVDDDENLNQANNLQKELLETQQEGQFRSDEVPKNKIELLTFRNSSPKIFSENFPLNKKEEKEISLTNIEDAATNNICLEHPKIPIDDFTETSPEFRCQKINDSLNIKPNSSDVKNSQSLSVFQGLLLNLKKLQTETPIKDETKTKELNFKQEETNSNPKVLIEENLDSKNEEKTLEFCMQNMKIEDVTDHVNDDRIKNVEEQMKNGKSNEEENIIPVNENPTCLNSELVNFSKAEEESSMTAENYEETSFPEAENLTLLIDDDDESDKYLMTSNRNLIEELGEENNISNVTKEEEIVGEILPNATEEKVNQEISRENSSECSKPKAKESTENEQNCNFETENTPNEKCSAIELKNQTLEIFPQTFEESINIPNIREISSKTEFNSSQMENIETNETKDSKLTTSSSSSNGNKSNQTDSSDSILNVDLYREILLLKEEIKRLKENETKIKSENLRLKEEVNNIREEQKFL